MTLLSTTYTTEAMMQRKVGEQALIDWCDHDNEGIQEANVLDDSINEATVEIDLYCRPKYTASALAGAELIKRWATTLACFFASQSRGNPPPDSLARQVEKIYERLDLIRQCVMSIPGVSLANDTRPTWSNRTVDRRFRNNTIRVTRTNSSKAPTKLTVHRSSNYPVD
jgi:phage gp36-like protein